MINREISIPKVVIGLAVVMLISVAGIAAETPSRLTDVAISTIKGSTYVVVTTGGAAKYNAKLDASNRLVVDFDDTKYQWRPEPLQSSGEPITDIRGSQFRKDVTRLVVQLTRPMRYTIEREATGVVIVLSERPGISRPAVPAPRAVADSSLGGDVAATPATLATAVPVAKTSASVQLAQATPTAPPQGTVTATNGRRLISLDFKDADVVNLLRILAAESGRNIVIGDDVKGKMSISLRNVPWEQALETILETRGLQKVETGNVMRIVTTEQLTRERETIARAMEAKTKSEAEARARLAEAQLKEAQALHQKHAAEAAVREAEARGPLREETIRLSYADPNEVADTLIGILGLAGSGGAQLKACGQDVAGGGASQTPPPGSAATPPPIAEPPFSQLYGQAQAQQQGAAAPPPIPSPASARGLAIRSHCPTHTLFLRLYSSDLERIKKLIKESFDIPLPQVKIEARMEILDRSALEQIGIQWGGAAVGRSGSLALVGQGFQSAVSGGQTVPALSGVRLPDGTLLLDSTPASLGNALRGSVPGSAAMPNPASTFAGLLPISQATGDRKSVV